MYRRSYDAQGHAPFDEITPANVARLRTAYTYDTGFVQGHESPAVVNGRTLIVTTPLSNVVALDAVTGAVLWKYEHDFDTRALRTVCCDVVNRGVALAGDLVYVGTLDDDLVALDGRTGAVRWQRTLATPGRGYAVTGAPLVVGELVISGIAGGEYGAPGFIAAFDARTGEPRWKTATLPAAGTPASRTWPPGALAHGGGSTWLTGSYDPVTATLYWGVGNPGSLARRPASRAQSRHRLGARARPAHGRAQVGVPVHAQRLVGLTTASTRACSSRAAGPAAAARARRPQRQPGCARLAQRPPSLEHPVREDDRSDGLSRRRNGDRRSRGLSARRARRVRVPELGRRQELVPDRLRSRHAPAVRSDPASVHDGVGHRARPRRRHARLLRRAGDARRRARASGPRRVAGVRRPHRPARVVLPVRPMPGPAAS